MVASQRLTLCLTHVMRSSRVSQGAAKAFAVLNGVQALEVLWIWFPWLDVEIDENRAVFVQNTIHGTLPCVQVIKRIRFGIPRLACQTRKADRASARNIYSPVGFVGT